MGISTGTMPRRSSSPYIRQAVRVPRSGRRIPIRRPVQATWAAEERLTLAAVLEVAAGVLVLGLLFTAILVGLPILTSVAW